MLGRTHTAFGLAAYGGALIAAEHLGVHVTVPQLAAGTVVAAGSALAPDLDEAGSTPGRALPLSHLPIFGGHRTRTHTIAAVVTIGLAAVICSHWVDATAALSALMATMGATWASSFVRRHGALVALAAGSVLGVVVAKVVGDGAWLVLAVPLPYLSHLLGDAMTPGGVPLFMPGLDCKWSLNLFRTGKTAERALISPLVTVLAITLVALGARGIVS